MHRIIRTLVAALAAVALVALSGAAEARGHKKEDQARLTLNARPQVSFAPTRIFLTGEIKGGSDSNEALYCPTIEWNWGDGTISSRSAGCTPFEPGQTKIERTFVVSHIYRTSGEYDVVLTLRRGDLAVASAVVTVQVRPGIGEDGGV